MLNKVYVRTCVCTCVCMCVCMCVCVYVCMYVYMYHKQSQLHKDESNVQYSQAADREIELIPKYVSPVCNCCPLDTQWIIIRENNNN